MQLLELFSQTELHYSVHCVLCFLTVNVTRFDSMCCGFFTSVTEFSLQRWFVVSVNVKQYSSVSLQY